MRNVQVRRLDDQKVETLYQLVRAQTLVDRLSILARKKRGEIRRQEASVKNLLEATSKRYDELAVETEVSHALSEINKTSAPQVSLKAPEAFQAELAKMASDHQSVRDDHVDFKETDPLAGTEDVKTLQALTERFQQELRNALNHQLSTQKEVRSRKELLRDSLSKETQLESETTRVAAKEKEKINLELKSVRDKIKRYQNETDQEEKSHKDRMVQISTLREAFVKCVNALNKAVERGDQPFAERTGDDQIKRATETSKEKPNPPLPRVASEEQRSYLANVEELIQSQAFPLEPDKTVLWVNASLNGKPDLRMVIDPFAETIRLSARTAAALGINKAEDEPEVQVVTADGSPRPAFPARARSVKVGPYEVSDVECLIMPDGYEAPPLLGASFLENFVSKVDPEAATLTLVRVDVRPLQKSTTRIGAGGKAKGKRP